MNEINIFFFLICIINLLFVYNVSIISKLINIYDHPNSRKIHKKKVPLLGGFLFILSILFYAFFNQFQINYKDDFINVLLILFLVIFFVIGFIDDKFELSSMKKILLFLFFLFFLVYSNENLQIQNLKFQTLDKSLELKEFNVLFSIFCIFLFLNAFNMYDGINGQSGIYTIIIFTYFLLKDINFYLSALIILTSLFFVFSNLKNKFFLGNSGSLLLALLISVIIINGYNDAKISNCEEIFVLLMLPGIDMARLFIQRILYKKNPFKADSNHFHHILLKKYSSTNVIIINSSITLFSIIMLYLDFQTYIIISLFMVIYIYLLMKNS